jgi:hypothetical protein
MTYILMAKEGLSLRAAVAYPAGAVFAVAMFALYMWALRRGGLPWQSPDSRA